ncbi:MAG: MaoC/PaaZ C-terminal domain-containing protein [Pseudomonadota bacterium]
MSPNLYFDDFYAGATFDCGTTRFTAEEIVDFARQFDPQPFHVDAEAGRASMLGGLAASGWHTCAQIMRMAFDGFIGRTASRGGPGVQEVIWRRPVLEGMEVSVMAEVVSARPSASRPDRGIVTVRYRMTACDDGRLLCDMTFPFFVLRNPERGPYVATGAETVHDRAPRPQRNAASVDFSKAVTGPDAAMWLDVKTAPIGKPIIIGQHTLTADEIVTFAERFDPQPFHLDPMKGTEVFGGLSASGWHTGSLWMGQNVRHRDALLATLPPDKQKQVLAASGPALGVTDLRWPHPVLAGDSLTFFTVLEGMDPWRGDWLALRAFSGAVNQRGALVFGAHSQVLRRAL